MGSSPSWVVHSEIPILTSIAFRGDSLWGAIWALGLSLRKVAPGANTGSVRSGSVARPGQRVSHR
jgi:hypothetical protein